MTPSETQRTLSGLNPTTGGTGIRNLQLQSGDPASLLGNTTNASQGLGTTSRLSSGAYQNFIMKVMELLKQSQGLGTKPFEEQALGLQEEQVNRTMAPATPGMSPTQQSAIRQADVGAIEPSIAGTTKRAQTFSEQLKGFGTALDQAVALGGFLNQKAQTDKQEARDLVLNFPDATAKMDEKQAKELFSQAGIPWDLKDSLIAKVKPEKWSDPYTISSGDTVQKNDKTGEIKVISKASEAGTKPLSGDAAKIYSISTTIIPEINQLKKEFETDYKGALRGIVSKTDRRLVKLVDNIADKVGRLRSGGAINKDEEERFKRQIASGLDVFFGKGEDAITALDGIITEANSVSQSMKPSGGVKIPVLERATGNTGWIFDYEFDPSIYTKLTQ